MSIVLFTLSGTLAVSLAGGPSAALRFVAQGQNPFLDRASHFLLLALVLLIATALLSGFFRIAVIRRGVRRRVWPGAVLTIAASGSASLAFAYYAHHLARFALFYGTLSAVAITLGWLWIMCLTLLLGAELNLQLEDLSDQRVASTHTPQPSGQLGGRLTLPTVVATRSAARGAKLQALAGRGGADVVPRAGASSPAFPLPGTAHVVVPSERTTRQAVPVLQAHCVPAVHG